MTRAVARCIPTPHAPCCDWTLKGDITEVDREARRHTGEKPLKGGPGHATSVQSPPPGERAA